MCLCVCVSLSHVSFLNSLCVFVCVRVYPNVFVSLFGRVCVRVYLLMCARLNGRVRVCLRLSLSTCVYECLYLLVCGFVCVSL